MIATSFLASNPESGPDSLAHSCTPSAIVATQIVKTFRHLEGTDQWQNSNTPGLVEKRLLRYHPKARILRSRSILSQPTSVLVVASAYNVWTSSASLVL
jgi:hypothetical protein